MLFRSISARLCTISARILWSISSSSSAHLLDRSGIKWALDDENIDHKLRAEIVQSLAETIRAAHAAQGEAM